MFELTETALERIVFAMEDQSRTRVVDLRTGELEAKPEGELPDFLAPPPAWTPADGFKLMEGFCAKLKNIELKHQLQRTLARGKGVFKAFKAQLAEYPEEEALFKRYKAAALRRCVETWLDDMRESLGLARLGPEPEEFEELSDSEFSIESSTFETPTFDIVPLVESAFGEALSSMPAAAAALEKTETLEFLTKRRGPCTILAIRAAQGEPIAAAAAAILTADGRSLGLIRFLHAQKDYRELDLEVRLLENLRAWFNAKGIDAVLLRSLFISSEFSKRLTALGIVPFDSQYFLP
jgi:hypothetical protein